jgi:hypothetical protein
VTTTEDILKAYKEGYKDGYNEAVKFYITNPMLNMRPQDNAWASCPVCGRTGVSGVVCNISNCPTKAHTGTIGAVGGISYPVGANGPADPAMSWEKR